MSKTRILCVDDDPVNIELLQCMLEDEYELGTATTGVEALEMAEEFNPDLILLDIMMPEMDGYEACRKIRLDPTKNNVKVILVSARARESDLKRGFEVGADHYLTKPFDEDELLDLVRESVALA